MHKPVFVAALCALLAATNLVCAQNYPNKVVRIVTAEPGASNDIAARIIAQGLTAKLGQQVIVENRGGASGAIAVQNVAKGSPDGYTLLLFSDSLWLAPFLQSGVTYDPIRDFTTITTAAVSPNLLVVHHSLAVNNVKDLVALARAKPGQLNYATGSTGSSNHLAGELFKKMTDVNIVRIPFKGASAALNSVVGGHEQLMFASAATGWPQVKSGKLRGLGIATLQPSALAPGLPTLTSSGLPGFEAASTSAMFAPAKTPVSIVTLLNREAIAAMNQPEAKERLFNGGMDVAGSTPAAAAAKIKSEMAKWGKLIKDAGIHAD